MSRFVPRIFLFGFRSALATPCRRGFLSGILPKTGKPSELDCKWEQFFNRPEIDGWEVRKGLCELHGMDLVPSPPIIIAVLQACRRVNDFALAIRALEAVKFKCGNKVNELWPYILDEISPTLDELGINTPEEMGYDKPELWLEEVD